MKTFTQNLTFCLKENKNFIEVVFIVYLSTDLFSTLMDWRVAFYGGNYALPIFLSKLACLLLISSYFIWSIIVSSQEREYFQGRAKELAIENGHLYEELQKERGSFQWKLNVEKRKLNFSRSLESYVDLSGGMEGGVKYLYQLLNLMSDKCHEKFIEEVDRVIEGKANFSCLVQLNIPNNEVVWLNFDGIVSLNHLGEKEVSGIVKDKTKEMFKESKINDLIQFHPHPSFLITFDEILSLNKEAETFLTIDGTRLVGCHPILLSPPALAQGATPSGLMELCLELHNEKDKHYKKIENALFYNGKRAVEGNVTILELPRVGTTEFLVSFEECEEQSKMQDRILDLNRSYISLKRKVSEMTFEANTVLEEYFQESLETLDEFFGPELAMKKEILQLKENMSDSLKKKINVLKTIGTVEQEEKAFISPYPIVKSVVYGLKSEIRKRKHEVRLEGDGQEFGLLEMYPKKFKKICEILLSRIFTSDENLKLFISLKSSFKADRHGHLQLRIQDWEGKNKRPKLYGAMGKAELKELNSLKDERNGYLSFSTDDGQFYMTLTLPVERDFNLSIREEGDNSEQDKRELKAINTLLWEQFNGNWEEIEKTIMDYIQFYPQIAHKVHLSILAKDSEGALDNLDILKSVIGHFPLRYLWEKIFYLKGDLENLRYERAERELEKILVSLNYLEHELRKFTIGDKHLAS